MEIDSNVLSKFEEYMNKEIPGYEGILDEERIKKLLDKYNALESSKKTASFCLDKALDSNSEIDYLNDFEKANERMALLADQIRSEIELIKETYGIEKDQEEDHKLRV